MKNYFITFTLVMTVFLASVAKAQPALLWQKTYGGSGHEYACKTIPSSDGGFAFVGFSESSDGDVSANHGGEDLWVAKTSASGTIQWSFLFGGTADEEGYDLVQTTDGGFMVAGWTDSYDGDVTGHHGTSSSDIWLLKLTAAGALSWAKCYGGTSDDEAKAIVKTLDGNFYVSGSTYSNDGDVSGNHANYYADFWVIKIDASGTLLNQKCVGGTNYDEGINMALTSDNGCILCGRTGSGDGDAVGYHGGSDMLIAKLDASFTVEWSKCYGGTETEECNAIVQLTDGSYTALGYTSTHNNGDITGHHGAQGADDFWLIHLTSTGALSWAKCLGGSGDDQANGLAATADGGYILTGLTNSTDGDVTGFHSAMFEPDVWIAKVNAGGTLQWQRCCGGTGQDEAFNVFELSNGVYVVTAFSYSADYDVTNNHGSADGWIFKVSGSTGIEVYDEGMLMALYPNPTASLLNIDLQPYTGTLYVQIINAYGQLLYEKTLFDDLTIDLSDMHLNNGQYFLKINDGKHFAVRKFIISY